MNEKRKLRILIVIPNLFVAGAQKMVEQLVNRLDYGRFEVRLIVLSAPVNNYLEKSVSRSGAEILYLHKKPGFHIAPLIQAWKALNAFRPDVIHSHLRGWIYLAPWILLHRVKVIHTIHSRPKGYESRALLFLMRRFYRSKFIPVAISDEIAKEAAIVYKLPVERIETVFNPVSFQCFSEAERIPHPDFRFVMVARFDPVKNHLFLIDVFSQVRRECKNARLLLAGEGELMEAAKVKVRELKLQEAVEFLGVVEDVPALLAGSDVFVLPSLREGLPMTVLEAEASGLPVIASDVGGIPDIVGENGYLVPVGDSEKFRGCMVRLAGNPGLCAEMGRMSKTIAKRYDIDKIADQYEELYEKYAAGN